MSGDPEKRQQSAQEAMDDLKHVLWDVYDPPVRRLLFWLDRQLRRWPRFYVWLSR